LGGNSGCAGVRFRFRVAFGATKPLPSRPQNILNCPELSLHNPRNFALPNLQLGSPIAGFSIRFSVFDVLFNQQDSAIT
jgi:hypothetical protein